MKLNGPLWQVRNKVVAILTLSRRYSVVLPTCLTHKTAIECGT